MMSEADRRSRNIFIAKTRNACTILLLSTGAPRETIWLWHCGSSSCFSLVTDRLRAKHASGFQHRKCLICGHYKRPASSRRALAESDCIHTASGIVQKSSRPQPHSFPVGSDRICVRPIRAMAHPALETRAKISQLGRKLFTTADSASLSVRAPFVADDRGSHVTTGSLWRGHRKTIRYLGAGMGLMGLGLDQSRNHFVDRRHDSRLDLVHRDPPPPAPLVVLFLANLATAGSVLYFYRAVGH